MAPNTPSKTQATQETMDGRTCWRPLHGEHPADGRASRLASGDVTTERVRIDLSGAPQTMLATLYAKALDADFRDPILGDRFRKKIVERIDYDWQKTTMTARRAPSVTTRTAQFDAWTNLFLAAHPQAVVLHMGCGLDSRFFRLRPGAEVQWYDVDYPEVAALRTQLYPPAEH